MALPTLYDNDLFILLIEIIGFLVAVLQEIIHILCGIEDFVTDFGVGQESVVAVSAQGGIVYVQQFLDFGIGVERLGVTCSHFGTQSLKLCCCRKSRISVIFYWFQTGISVSL